MAVSKMIIKREIDLLVENIKAHPKDAQKYADWCAGKLRDYTSSQVRNALVTMVISLYDNQIMALRADIAKCALAGSKDADPAERAELLRCLIGCLKLFFGDDYSFLSDMCTAEIERRIKYGEGEEDSWKECIYDIGVIM